MKYRDEMFSAMDLWKLVDGTFNLMHTELHQHHQMVSYLAYHMAMETDFPPIMQHLTLQAAYLHDVGAVIESDQITLADVEQAGYHAAQISANLLEDFPVFFALAAIVRHCQTPYRDTRKLRLPALKLPQALSFLTERMPKLPNPVLSADIIHVADAVSLMIDRDKPVLNQVENILKYVKDGSGDEFSPQAVSTLEKLADREQIWMDLAYSPEKILEDAVETSDVGLDAAIQIAKLISVIIDFRSPFTAMHSAGVAASASALAALAGMNEKECSMMEIAGNLHDLGKIRTPQAILEKPSKLSAEEFNVIKEHAYFTELLLSKVQGFEKITGWAALHHEKMNGSGYPYHLKGDEIPLGAKVMAVADVFSAITEERPYRAGMPEEKVKSILRENAERGELSGQLVELLIANYQEVNQAREKASREAGRRYYRSMQESGGQN